MFILKIRLGPINEESSELHLLTRKKSEYNVLFIEK